MTTGDPAHRQRQHRPVAHALEEAEAVRDELCRTLRDGGIVLPSLRVEPLAYGEERPRPLIDLGRCTPDTARRMIAALRNAGSPGRTGQGATGTPGAAEGPAAP